MGWNDNYKMHSYVYLPLYRFVTWARTAADKAGGTTANLTLKADDNGSVITVDAIHDYIFRPDELDLLSLYEFTMSVNKVKIDKTMKLIVRFKEGHGQCRSHTLSVVQKPHVPICSFVPQTKGGTVTDDYALAVLLLFKPFRTINDLLQSAKVQPESTETQTDDAATATEKPSAWVTSFERHLPLLQKHPLLGRIYKNVVNMDRGKTDKLRLDEEKRERGELDETEDVNVHPFDSEEHTADEKRTVRAKQITGDDFSYTLLNSLSENTDANVADVHKTLVDAHAAVEPRTFSRPAVGENVEITENFRMHDYPHTLKESESNDMTAYVVHMKTAAEQTQKERLGQAVTVPNKQTVQLPNPEDENKMQTDKEPENVEFVHVSLQATTPPQTEL